MEFVEVEIWMRPIGLITETVEVEPGCMELFKVQEQNGFGTWGLQVEKFHSGTLGELEVSIDHHIFAPGHCSAFQAYDSEGRCVKAWNDAPEFKDDEDSDPEDTSVPSGWINFDDYFEAVLED